MAKRKLNSRGLTGIVVALLAAAAGMGWWWHADGSGFPGIGSESEPCAPRGETCAAEFTDVVKLYDSDSELKEYPGFTVSFNRKRHQPDYVAWELTAQEASSQQVSRKSQKFAADPDVPGCPTLDDYRGSGYDRGHMAPAGDMKWSPEAMEACFLLTNMSPQSHDLNQGSWRSLEEKCRDWALRDSAIVIVCGPIFDKDSVEVIGDTGVAVPSSYFKVVLAPYAQPPRAIGFIMNNGRVEGGMQKAVVSVDKVEEVTGLDFFSALPDEIEDMIEAECNFPRWSRKKY